MWGARVLGPTEYVRRTGWGSNFRSQLGHGDTEDRLVSHPV